MYKGFEITKEHYQARLETFIKERGPNPGKGFYGAWAWHAKMERKFKRKLLKELAR